LAALVAAASLACSPDKATDHETNDPSSCNTLVDDGPTIGFTISPGSPQTPLGGTFADGIYFISQANLYNTPPGFSNDTLLSAVFEFRGNVIQQVGHVDGVERRYTSTYTISGTTVTTTDTCPEPDSASFDFTATATEFRILGSNEGITLEQVYTKR
jgi:hypothetical protein